MAVDDNRQSEENFEEYEHFLEDYSHFAPPASDEVLQGTVLNGQRQRSYRRLRL